MAKILNTLLNITDAVWIAYYQRRAINYAHTPFERQVARLCVTRIREEVVLRKLRALRALTAGD